jgi:hypothetical protein
MNWDVLPCGCRIGSRNDTLYYDPCGDPGCEYLQFVLAESRRQGKPILTEQKFD